MIILSCKTIKSMPYMGHFASLTNSFDVMLTVEDCTQKSCWHQHAKSWHTNIHTELFRKSSTQHILPSQQCSGAVMIKTSPCMVQIASSSPPNDTVLLCLHHSCLLLSDAGFHTLALHVSIEKRKEKKFMAFQSKTPMCLIRNYVLVQERQEVRS